MGSWQIDKISQADELDPILAIEQRSFRWPWGRLSFEGELVSPNAYNLVVKSSGQDLGARVIAYAFFRLVADEIHLLKIAVTPAWRGQGIAGQLLQRCFQTSTAKGATSVHLEVRPSNTAAVEFYLKHGFELIGRRPKYYEDTKEDALLMMKHLKED